MTLDQNSTEPQRPPIGAALHRHMEHVLSTRHARSGTRAANLEERLKRGGTRVWSLLKRHPSVGIAAAAGVGLGAATVIGAGEILLAITAGYAAFQVLREGVRPGEAMKRSFESVEHTELP